MLSAIVIAPPRRTDSARRPDRARRPERARPFAPLLRTLAALVPATVEGVVRDVTLLCVGAAGEVAGIADEAGCGLVVAGEFGTALARSLEAARCTWVCVLQAGTLPGRTFGEDVSSALDEDGDPPPALLLREEGGTFGRLFPQFAAVAGVIVPRARLGGGPPPGSFAELLRRARPARTLTGRVAQVA